LTVHRFNLKVYCTEMGDKRQYARISSFSRLIGFRAYASQLYLYLEKEHTLIKEMKANFIFLP